MTNWFFYLIIRDQVTNRRVEIPAINIKILEVHPRTEEPDEPLGSGAL